MQTRQFGRAGHRVVTLFWRRMASLLLLAVVSTSAIASDTEDFDLEQVREQIRTQYDTIDNNMVSVHYRTHNRISRAGEEDRIEITSVDPSRPAGEKERLELVNGEPPDSSDIRRFERRPQPDRREEQPFRLTIDYDSLQLEDHQGDYLTFRFQPVLLVNGTPDADGSNFSGTLSYDLSTESLRDVEMRLDRSFRKMLFTISAFTVTERFSRDDRHDGLLLRVHYFHNLDIRNRLVNLSNQSTIRFDYD